MLIVLLVTYIVRVALTIILIAGAPLALMFHALPQTEGIAKWWWKAYGGVLAIQVGQSLTLITAMKVFLAPGGFTLFGPTLSGLVNLLVALALMYILFKIPFWILGSLRGGGGRSLVGSLVRGFLAYKTFGLLGGGGGGSRKPRPSGGGRGGGGGGSGPVHPYAHTRTTATGQYVLPLPGVRRTRPAPKPRPAPTPKPGGAAGRQLALPLGDDWPENKPVLGRDGQYRLPLDVERVKPTPPPASPSQPGSGGARSSRAATAVRVRPVPAQPADHLGAVPAAAGRDPHAAPGQPTDADATTLTATWHADGTAVRPLQGQPADPIRAVLTAAGRRPPSPARHARVATARLARRTAAPAPAGPPETTETHFRRNAMTTPDYSPDGLTVEDITALQREVTEELRREGHLPPPRRHRRRRGGTWPSGARGPSAPTSRRPATGPGHQRGEDR